MELSALSIDSVELGKKAIAWLLSSGLQILLIVVLTLVALRVSTWLIHRLIQKNLDAGGSRGRGTTVSKLLTVFVRVLLIGLMLTLILGEFGIDLGPIIATAGVFGLAIGFGAQELVKDIISGFFILLEDQIRVGDIVDLDGRTGTVELLSLRTVRLRDVEGNVHYVRNGGIDVIKNFARDFSCYVFDIGVSYDTDIDQAISVCKDVATDLKSDPEFAPDIVDEFEVFGLDRFADSSIQIKARIKTKVLRQWAVGREYNRRLKKSFDQNGISMPFPHRTVFLRKEENA